MPRFSVFTPSHKTRYLDECLASLLAQDFTDWEWVVLLNGNARWRPETPDDRIRIHVADDVTGIGDAKRRACAHATGDILVELDHDDILTSNALSSLDAAFTQHPDVVFVYSDTAAMLEDGGYDATRFNEEFGWVHRDVTLDGRTLLAPHSFEPTPHNLSYIWFAPNHVRAFTRDAYHRVGGYDATRAILDDQDLMARLYQHGAFHHIDDVLYIQRMHGLNTQRDAEQNERIQYGTVALYDRDIQANALAWAARAGLKALDFGAAHNRPDGYLGVDQYPGPTVDIVANLPERLPLDDNSVGVIRAVDFLEHVADKIALINELYRVLAPGGLLLSVTPSTDGRGAFQDPTHVAFYNENSFWYYTQQQHRQYVPSIEARFQISRLFTNFPSEWHEQHQISYVTANLIALKDGMPRNGGQIMV